MAMPAEFVTRAALSVLQRSSFRLADSHNNFSDWDGEQATERFGTSEDKHPDRQRQVDLC
jgi:hypothetical protein